MWALVGVGESHGLVRTHLSRRSVTCHVTPQVRILAIDPAFDVLMYVIVIPHVIKEMLKRFCGFGARSETTERERDSNSYSLRECGHFSWNIVTKIS